MNKATSIYLDLVRLLASVAALLGHASYCEIQWRVDAGHWFLEARRCHHIFCRFSY